MAKKRTLIGFIWLFTAIFCFPQDFTVRGDLLVSDNAGLYRIQAGAFKIRTNAENVFTRLKDAGLDPKYEDYLDFTRVLLTVNAHDVPLLIDKMKELGFSEIWLRRENTSPRLNESTVVDSDYYTLMIGESKTISAASLPNDSGVAWTSSDDSIVTVDQDGKITGVQTGSAVITASGNGRSETIDVAVVPTYDFYQVPKESESAISHPENTRSAALLTESRTEPTFRLAYRFTNPRDDLGASGINGGIDILAKGRGGRWLWTSYYQGGFFYDLNGVRHVMTNGVQEADNGVVLTVEPSFVYDGGVAYLELSHKLENTSGETVSGQRFGASSDVMIASNDNAPLAINDYGVLMTDVYDSEIASLNLKLICRTGSGITPASTVWIGRWGYGSHLNHIYDNGVSSSYEDGVDSAMAFSYQDITLDAGETKYFTIRFTLARNSR
jgi:hypothetical protein